MRRIAFAMMASFALLVTTAAPAIGSAADRIPVQGEVVWGEEQDPGTVWYSGAPTANSVLHVRNAQGTEWVVGSEFLEGQSVNIISLNAHFSCGDDWSDCVVVGGTLWTSFRWDLDAFEGGWNGSGAANFTGMLPDGRLLYAGTGRASGWGALEGWHLNFRTEVDPLTGIQTFTGEVFSTGT